MDITKSTLYREFSFEEDGYDREFNKWVRIIIEEKKPHLCIIYLYTCNINHDYPL